MTSGPGFQSIGELEDALLAQSYLPERGLATAVFLSPGDREAAAAGGRGGRRQDRAGQGAGAAPAGARLIRLQCYEGLDVSPRRLRVELRPPAAAHPRRAGGRRRRAGALRARLPHPPAAAGGDHLRGARGAADRRDRSRRRRVRGLPARGALGLPDHDPRDRHDRRRRAARRSSSPPTARASCTTRSSAAACFTGSPTPRSSARSRSCACACPACPSAWRPRRPRSSPGCARSTWPRRPAWPRRSTGRRRSWRWAARSSTRPSSSRRSAPC